MKNLDKLALKVPENCLQYVSCFKKSGEVHIICFGHELRVDFEQKIADFISACSELMYDICISDNFNKNFLWNFNINLQL